VAGSAEAPALVDAAVDILSSQSQLASKRIASAIVSPPSSSLPRPHHRLLHARETDPCFFAASAAAAAELPLTVAGSAEAPALVDAAVDIPRSCPRRRRANPARPLSPSRSPTSPSRASGPLPDGERRSLLLCCVRCCCCRAAVDRGGFSRGTSAGRRRANPARPLSPSRSPTSPSRASGPLPDHRP
jgi:hypothetical protein